MSEFTLPRRWRRCKAVAALMTVAVAGALAAAGPAQADEYKIYSPLVVRGENELELRGYDAQDSSPQINGDQQYRLSVGRGITSYWAVELYDILANPPGGNLHSHKVEMENRFQLTPMGEYWANLGLLQGLEIPTEAGAPYSLELIPIIEKQSGRGLVAANLAFERQFGTNRQAGTLFSYRVRLEYLLYRLFSPAVEFHGAPGPIGHFQPVAEQRQQLGPALYGVSYFSNAQTLYYSTAFLFGLTPASPSLTIAFRFEYEFFD